MAYLGRAKPQETTSSVLRSTYTGNGSTTTYALPGPVANETSIIATINGVTQQDAAYSTDGSNIIFVAAPALGDSIEIRTLSAVAMSYAPMAGSVVTGTIADGAVTTGKIADNSITTAKIAAGAVVQADIGTNVAGTGPTFMALMGTSQSVSTGTTTKILFNSKSWDTNSCYDATNSKFIPNVAGYYDIIASAYHGGATNTFINIFKNGNSYQRGYQTTSNTTTSTGSALVYCNGTTDYIEVYLTQNTGSTITVDAYDFTTRFSGVLVRAA
jgi:C1q domain